MTLQELMKLGADHAREMLVGTKDQYLTQFTLVKPNGHIDIIATPWADNKEKRQAVLAVCLEILKEGVTSYCWTTEAWFARTSFEGDKAPPPVGLRPEQRADRREAIVIIASDGNEHPFASLEIIRDKEGNCARLEELPGAEGFESWITEALDRAVALNALDKDGSLAKKFKEFLP